jgi:chaperonin GroES
MNLTPLGDRLIVEPLEEEQTTIGGIVLPDTAVEKPQRGSVIAVGPGGRSSETGDRIPLDIAAGDTVVFSKYGGTEIRLEGVDYLILRESDVLAKVVAAAASGKAKAKAKA